MSGADTAFDVDGSVDRSGRTAHTQTSPTDALIGSFVPWERLSTRQERAL